MTTAMPNQNDGELREVTRHLLGTISGQDRRDTPGPSAASPFVGRARPGERLQFALQERNAELELRLREWEARKQIYELEFRALDVASQFQRSYAAYLEATTARLQSSTDYLQGKLEEEAAVRVGLLSELERLRVEVAALLAELERLRAESAGLSRMLTAVLSRRSYRLLNKVVPIIRKALLPLLFVRRLILRRTRG